VLYEFIGCTGKHWSKAQLTNCQYNGRDIDTLEPDIDARVVELIDLLRTKYSNTVVDIAAITRFFTLDVLSTVAFGRPFGFMAANADLWDYDKMTTQAMLLLEWVVNHASFRWLFQSSLVQALAAPKSTDSRGMGPMLGFARAAVAERFGPDPKVKKDMLGHFVGKGLSQLRCEVEANLQIVAGSDSTTTVLRSTLFLLAGTPMSYAKLRAEIDAATNDGSLSYPVASYTEAQKLPYLTACLWEGLRMYPPLFGLKSKTAPPGGDTFKGVYYPEGAEVAVCDDALCRNIEIFGTDPHLFRPDRWILADTATRVKYRQTVDAVFGSGRFMCLGRHIAMMELHKAIVEVRYPVSHERAESILMLPSRSYCGTLTGRSQTRSEASTRSLIMFTSSRTWTCLLFRGNNQELGRRILCRAFILIIRRSAFYASYRYPFVCNEALRGGHCRP
jgi:cytochrome P450